MNSKGKQVTLNMFSKKKKVKLTLRRVFNDLKRLAKTSGDRSQMDKAVIVEKLLMDAEPDETKYIIRWLNKNLKTGAAEKTVISAFARAVGCTPPM